MPGNILNSIKDEGILKCDSIPKPSRGGELKDITKREYYREFSSMARYKDCLAMNKLKIDVSIRHRTFCKIHQQTKEELSIAVHGWR